MTREKGKPKVRVIETETVDPDRKTSFADVDYGMAALKQFGEGVVDAAIGFAKAVMFAFAFAFDGLRDLFKKKRKDEK